MLEKIGIFFIGTWGIGSLLSGFIMGAAVLAMLYIEPVAWWFKTITVYDLLKTIGIPFSIVMALVGIYFGFTAENPNTKSIPGWAIGMGILGVIILVALIVGRFVWPLF